MVDMLNNIWAPTAREVVTTGLVYVLYRILWTFVYRPWTSPLRNLRAPPGGKGLMGHFADIIDLYNHELTDSWVTSLGRTFRVQGMFWVHHRIWTIDARAVAHIMSKPYEYKKPGILRRALMRYMKSGLIPAEGVRHRVQRKVVQKLFSGQSLRAYAGLIQHKADQMRDSFADLLADPSSLAPFCPDPASSPSLIPSSAHSCKSDAEAIRSIDMYGALSRALFDLIGEIGIGHRFNSFDDPHGEGGRIFHEYDRMQQMVPGAQGLRFELSVLWPGVDRWFPTENSKRVAFAMGQMEELSQKRMQEVRAEMAGGHVKRDDGKGYTDLLTLMVQSTMAPNVPTEQKMYEDEISGQLATFMFAGTDTTAGSLAFGLRLLAMSPSAQTRLRDECLAYGDSLPFEQIDGLVYLDAVVREMIRMLPSIPSTIREATADDLIPLASPIVTATGETLNSIPIRKGQVVHLPIENLNMSTHIWGPDAREFKPERWLRPAPASHSASVESEKLDGKEGKRETTGVPPEVGDGPGVWPNMMTFIDGPRRCVGYRLGLMEMKIFLYTLIREYEFGVVPGKRVYKINMISTRPFVGGELAERGYQLPLLVRAYKG